MNVVEEMTISRFDEVPHPLRVGLSHIELCHVAQLESIQR